jgi:hypothetical protein
MSNNNGVFLNSEEILIMKFLDMCDESLCPESHDGVEKAIRELTNVRKNLCFDITGADTYDRIREWQKEERNLCHKSDCATNGIDTPDGIIYSDTCDCGLKPKN